MSLTVLDFEPDYLDKLQDRFWVKVQKTDSCWNWTAAQFGNGYGVIGAKGRSHLAHRVAYQLLKGSIPEGLQVDHLYRNRLCVNPDHMELVTNQENTRRGTAGDWQRSKTHCPWGHEYTEDNIVWYHGGRHRACKACGYRGYSNQEEK